MEPDDMHFLILLFAYVARTYPKKVINMHVVVGGGDARARTLLFLAFKRVLARYFNTKIIITHYKGIDTTDKDDSKKEYDAYVKNKFKETGGGLIEFTGVSAVFKDTTPLVILLKQFQELNQLFETNNEMFKNSTLVFYAGGFNVDTGKDPVMPIVRIANTFREIHFVSAAPYVGDNNVDIECDMRALTKYSNALEAKRDVDNFVREYRLVWNRVMAVKWLKNISEVDKFKEKLGKIVESRVNTLLSPKTDETKKNALKTQLINIGDLALGWTKWRTTQQFQLTSAVEALNGTLDRQVDSLMPAMIFVESFNTFMNGHDAFRDDFFIGKLNSVLMDPQRQGVVADPLVFHIITTSDPDKQYKAANVELVNEKYWTVKTKGAGKWCEYRSYDFVEKPNESQKQQHITKCREQLSMCDTWWADVLSKPFGRSSFDPAGVRP
jgi:hypothetical protein